eukprot:11227607-Lingulodinium_polyedra.AAC.1
MSLPEGSPCLAPKDWPKRAIPSRLVSLDSNHASWLRAWSSAIVSSGTPCTRRIDPWCRIHSVHSRMRLIGTPA